MLAGNRDELHARATREARPWEDVPGAVGGRDLEAGGSWLAVGRGRLATVTNVREPGAARGGRSRGELVAGYHAAAAGAAAWAHRAVAQGADYGGFNLLTFDGAGLWWASNRAAGPVEVSEGVHGVSNGGLDTPWPKVRSGVEALTDAVDRGAGVDALFTLLADRTVAPDHALPDTGVGLALERFLSPRFLSGPVYGTRASTVVCLDAAGDGFLEERRFGPDGVALGSSRLAVGAGP